MRSNYIFSTIFEKEEDCKNNPFVFEKFSLNKRKEEYAGQRFQGKLFKKSRYKENQSKELFFVLHEHTLIQFQSENDDHERGILSIKNARLKKEKFKDEEMNYTWGFTLMAKGNQIEFYSQDQEHIQQWIEELRTSVVFVDLKEDYHISSLIGKGNFARVHQCRRKSDDAIFALKSIEKALIRKSKRNSSSILFEIDVLRSIKHDNIICMKEVHESEKYIHMVFEYLEGGELFERIKSKGLYSEKDAIDLMRAILQALDYLHAKNIVHRDLKPENLILASKTSDQDIKIADFGLASFIQPGELLNLRCGSPGYVAPELLEDKGYNTKADIFSAGIILYVLLSGRPAFPGSQLHEILIKNKRCEIAFPPKYWEKISNQAKDLVQKMVMKDPKLRITAKEALTHQWFNTEPTVQQQQVFLDVQKNMKQLNLGVDTKGGKEDLNLLTCTPVLGGRKIGNLAESPFLSSAGGMNNATPMMQMRMLKNQKAEDQIKIGGVVINKQPVGGDSANGNAMGLPQIPQFKRGANSAAGAQVRRNLQDYKQGGAAMQPEERKRVDAAPGQISISPLRNLKEEDKEPLVPNAKENYDADLNEEDDEDYCNLTESMVDESAQLDTGRIDTGQKSFKPGKRVLERQLPTAPGTDKMELWKVNKPSKKRVTLKQHLGEQFVLPHICSDVGGSMDFLDEVYLYDYEELKRFVGSDKDLSQDELIQKISSINFRAIGSNPIQPEGSRSSDEKYKTALGTFNQGLNEHKRVSQKQVQPVLQVQYEEEKQGKHNKTTI